MTAMGRKQTDALQAIGRIDSNRHDCGSGGYGDDRDGSGGEPFGYGIETGCD